MCAVQASALCAVALGLCMGEAGVSIMHDVNHGAGLRSRSARYVLGTAMDLVSARLASHVLPGIVLLLKKWHQLLKSRGWPEGSIWGTGGLDSTASTALQLSGKEMLRYHASRHRRHASFAVLVLMAAAT